jgi:pantoate--beta-alanine ligase
LERLQAPALLLVAATVGATRLIDNFLLRADGAWETGMKRMLIEQKKGSLS